MLRLIEGTSGSGKTAFVRETLKQKALAGEEKLMLLVPEQNSFENEREILRMLGAKDARRITVMSFTRLVDFVMRETGGLAGRRLNDSGRNMLMSLAIEQVGEELTLYRRHAKSAELVEMMLTALKEFKMCGIEPQGLIQASASLPEGTLKKKVRETALIMEAYEALVAQSYIDPLDDLSRLKRVLEGTPFFTGYTIMADAFAGFTMQELSVLRLMLRQAKEVWVSVCVDQDTRKDNGMGLFSPVRKTVRQLMSLAKEDQIPVAPAVRLLGTKRYENEELKLLEQGAFRREQAESTIEPRFITVYNAADPYDEADFVSRSIRRLVLEEGLRYREITVIARDTEQYRGILDAALENYEIPYFMDRPEALDAKPLMNLVLSAFDCIHSGYKPDEIFRFLKTGLTDLSPEETALLENYALLWQVTGKRWLEEFTMHPDGFSETMEEADRQELLELNRLRKLTVGPLTSFERRLQKATGREIAKAVYQLLEDVHAAAHCRELAGELQKLNEWNLAQEELRLWDMLMELLDQSALVLGEHPVSSKRWAELFSLVVRSQEIAFIPQGIDEVAVGGADRSRPAKPKAVFLVGAAEGEFPRTPVAAGVFSDPERRQMIALGLPLYDALEKLAVEERFLAYLAMVAPSQRLYLSFAGSDLSGGAKSPSSIIKETQRIFPGLIPADQYSLPQEDKIWAEKPAFDLTAKLWRTESPLAESLRQYFSSLPRYKGRLQALQRAGEDAPLRFTRPETASKLFGNHMRVSASQVEKFYLCRFQYFCRYGLKAKERRPAVFDALEYGSLMHYVLEHMLKQFTGAELAVMERQALRGEVNALLTAYVEARLGGWEDKNARFKYLFFRLSDTAQLLLSHMGKELAQSEFVPADFELSVGRGRDLEPLALSVPGGGDILVEGKIDRVDVMKKAGISYIRVIDYKTGTKDFKLSDVLYGLNLQMLLYLDTVWKNGESRYGGVLPAGMLYMPAVRPMVNASRQDGDGKIEKEKLKKLRMNGLVLDDPIVIAGMEEKAEGVFIPVALKNGEPAKLSSVASLSQMGALAKKLESLVVGMACALKQGDIGAVPASGEYDACAYCPYGPVCGHEKDGESRNVESLDRARVMELLEKEEKGEQPDAETKLDD